MDTRLDKATAVARLRSDVHHEPTDATNRRDQFTGQRGPERLADIEADAAPELVESSREIFISQLN